MVGCLRNRGVQVCGGALILAGVLTLGSCGSDSPGGPNALSCSATPARGEAPLTVTFSATGRSTQSNDYHWVFSDGTAESGQTVTSTLSRGGVHNARVTLTTTRETCTTNDVVVGAPVRLNCFADPDKLIVPGEIHFRAEPAGGDGNFTYAWDFGDGTSSTEKDPVHPYHQAGRWTVRVTATSTGASASCTQEVQAFEGGLGVSCSASPTEGEAPLAVSFRADATGGSGTYTYFWQFGPGASASGKTASYTYRDHGVFEARVTVHSAAAAGTCTQTIYVNRPVVCGNGLVQPGEECDDGNTTNGDGCNSACKVEHGFSCSGARSRCKSTCGDGLVASNEGCDDANTTNGDGCSSSCKVEGGFTCTGEPSVCF